ncbi:unnamed protein product [Arabidopsis lyrata]|uniref:beta-glucosidase n=1 Tax=Arabidopsis lyrata subsp. lyrata TaxID=81972 RepID=D7KXA8_ARALL|nr:predicted protein [Arabidopsis lyrata subsp. lyrata]CAH8256386.1 unnamed protein product [Arabidopsis lyrata]
MFGLWKWEGAVAEDGRKPSVWDTFCHSQYNQGNNGDITCDGYHNHKYKEDVKLMVDTNLDAFRFSMSWSRLIPNRKGPVNQKGLQFYKNLIQELINHGIEPYVTLHHFDHPQYLEDEYGGWLNHTIVEDFTAYADVCFREFGNHVKFWTTINEGNIFSIGGYSIGDSPPGRCSKPDQNCLSGNSSTEPYIVGHNLLLAHASVSRLYKQKYKLYIGINHYLAASITNSKLKPSISGNPDFFSDMNVFLSFFANFSSSEYDVAPWAVEAVLEYVKQSYGNPPVYILENGRPIKQDSQLKEKDTPRTEFLQAYISDPHRKRSPKLSAHWYSDFLKGKSASLGSQGITELQIKVTYLLPPSSELHYMF